MKHIRIREKKTLPHTIRLLISITILILILISISITYAAYQQPTTIQTTQPAITYTQQSSYTYITHLKNNTIYNTPLLLPDQGIIFKKITDYITLYYSYQCITPQPTTISGSYSLNATIKTNLWEKPLTLQPTTPFTTDTYNSTYQLNITTFDNILMQINQETDTIAQNPRLILDYHLHTIGTIIDTPFTDTLTHTITIPLGEKTIELQGDLFKIIPKTIDQTIQITLTSIINQRIYGLTSIAILGSVFLIFIIFTQDYPTSHTTPKTMLKKIQKKYGEWIAEAEVNPRTIATQTIPITSLKDLSKISEELGKPMIHYIADTKKIEEHIFYIIDNTTIYKYRLKPTDKI